MSHESDFIQRVNQFAFQLQNEDLIALEITACQAMAGAERCGCAQCVSAAITAFQMYENAFYLLYPQENTVRASSKKLVITGGE